MKTTLHSSFIGSALFMLVVLLGTTSFAQSGVKVNGTISTSLQGVTETMNTYVAPPANFDFGGERDVVISVTYNGFTTAAQNAFQYAVDIWASQLTSNVPILIDATWSDLPGNTLGSAGAEGFWYNFTGAPSSNVYYPSALADKLAGYDLDPGFPDVVANFDSGTDWYFGTDGNPAFDEFDFVSVVLHELGHGLGVQGSADKIGSTGYLGLGSFDYPIVYDLYVENGSGTAITSYTNPSTALGTQLTGNSLYWNGSNAEAANSGISPRLYAPSPWEPGSSYSHLNESTYMEGNANSLMTPQIGYAEAIHSPGPIILGLMADIGWEVDNSGGGCAMASVDFESTACNGDNPIITMYFNIDGGCTIDEICSSENGGAFACEDISGLLIGDGGGVNFNAALADTDYEFYFTLSDGTQSGVYFYANGNCGELETICDCAGTEHTIGVLGWLGDGYADNNAYEWDGQLVDFECATWGYDCGDIAGSPSDDPYNTCGGDLPPNNGCAGAGCVMADVAFESTTCNGVNPVITMFFTIDGGCTVDEICSSENGGAFTCEDISALLIGDGGGVNFNAALANTDYEFYYTLSDGSQSDLYFFANGSCDDFETICDCAGTEHTIGVLTWLGDGYADNNAYEWEGQLVDFECETWGYDCGDIAGSPTDDPYNTCGGDLPPNNGCAGGGCVLDVVLSSNSCNGVNPIINMVFSIEGGCTIDEICASENGGAFACEDITALETGDGDGVNFNAALADTDYEFYYTLSDGSQSDVYFFANGNCDDVETICDCAGTEHSIGVLTWLGDGYADNNAYEWEGQLVDFECATWGYDCGDIDGSPTDDPYNTCGGDLPPNNGCSGGGDCSYNGINVYIDGCGESLTDVMFFEFDYEGDCLVTEICYQSTFSADEGCFPMIGNDLGSGDVWGINGLGEGVWEFYYSLDDGSSSPLGSLTITSCVQVEGCVNPYATNYDENADIDDGSCTYDETICDCAGTEHTIGVIVWIGDGFADNNAYEWDGQFVDFECAAWGYDCGDIDGSPTDDPNNVCGGDLPPNNGCEIIETPGCTDSEACNYDADATIDNGSCEYSSCAGCMNPSACNYDPDATLADGSCEFDSCAGCTNPNACNYDEDAILENGSCEYNSCAGCTNEEACNYDSEATIENGSCDFSCYGCTDTTALNYDSEATIDDGTCSYDQVDGCIDDSACNYNPFATNDDGSCEYLTCAGCTDFLACNFDVEATIENGTCDYSCYGCTDPDALNYDANATIDDGTCSYEVVEGCTDDEACNYNPFATDDDGSCEFVSCAGCTDPLADNYDSTATIDDGSCVYGGIEGCTDSEALNYDPAATIDDGSCIFNCDFPDITYTPFCEPGEPDVYYIEMDISDLGNGAPYSVTNNANANEFEISFNGSIELGPFGNNIEVVILVSSLTLDGCIVSSPPQNNNCDVSVDELEASSFALYPNPTNGLFTIQTNNFEGKTIVEILDATGKLVESHELILSADQNQAMDLSNLANGIYVIRLRSNETVAVDQLIIRR